MARIKNARVVVTGASSGIGRAIAFEAARKGGNLILASPRLYSLRKVADEIQNAFADAPIPLAVSCDVTRREDVAKLIKTSVDRLGGIDILINNAGIGVYGPSDKTSLEDFRSVMEVNFFGAVNCILEALPFMKREGKGLVVNIASVAAKHGVPFLGAYSASKAALAAFSQSLRAELVRSGISLMVVYPGYTQTEFFLKEKKVGGAHRPLGPYASVTKVSRAIVRAIEIEKRELVLSVQGKALAFSQGLMPWLVERAMQRIAFQLKD
jgi:short-subunit dehydrogenase